MSSCRCSSVLFFILFELIDLFCDVFFVLKLFLTEQEIIKDNSTLRYSGLAFAVVAFILFILESINIYKEVFKKHKWAYADVTSVLTTWLEDVPHIIIAVYVAFKVPEPISWIQYGKAGYASFEALVRLIASLIYACKRRQNHHCSLLCIALFKIMASIIIFASSTAIFVKLL